MKGIIGFDLGGTKMLAALMDLDGYIIDRLKQSTGIGGDTLVSRIAEHVRELLTKHPNVDCIAMGIAFPGPINAAEGIILSTPNIGISDTPVVSQLQNELNLPVYLFNDVNAGIYGEFKFGAGQGSKNIVGIFPGTGVGGGLIINGALYSGTFGGAGEFGHMIIMPQGPMCGCGQRGCLESLASRTALAKELVHLAATGESPTVLELAGTDYKQVKSSVIKKAIKNKEKRVIDSVKQNAYYLGIGMANAANIINPEKIILGGGLVEKLGQPYIKWARESMLVHGMKKHVQEVTVLPAALGDDAVLLGAATLALEEFNNES